MSIDTTTAPAQTVESGSGGRLPLHAIQRAVGDEVDLVTSGGTGRSAASLAARDQQLARQGRSRLTVRVIGDVTQVGPFLRPGDSGCVWCADQRHRAVLAESLIDGVDTSTSQTVADDVDRAVVAATWTPLLAALAQQVVARSVLAPRAEGRPVACIQLSDGTVSWHRVTPVMQCPWCASGEIDEQPGRFRSQPIADQHGLRSKPLPDAGALEELLVDHRFGPVRRIYRDANAPGALDGVEVAIPGVGRRLWGYGRSSDHTVARSVGLLEAIERENGCTPQRTLRLERGSYRDLIGRFSEREVLDPASLGQPDPAFDGHEFSVTVPYTPDTETTWVQGWAPLRDSRVWLPEHLAYYGAPDRAGSARYLYECSNGAALGGNREEATVHGLFELLERDSFLLNWYSRTPLHPFDLSTLLDPEALLYLERATAEGYQVHLFDATSDVGVPVVQALVVNESRPDAVTFSTAGAHLDPQRAARAALLEVVVMILVQGSGRRYDRDERLRMLADPTSVRDMDDHVSVHTLPESLARFSHLLDSGLASKALPNGPVGPMADVAALGDMGRVADRLCAEMGRCGMDPVVVDLSSEMTRHLGLAVVKVVAAGAVPLTFGHVHHRTLGIPRLEAARRATGTTGTPLPHPFP